jgi:peptidoglycan hydrolase-like protein with peptidoglycan-binding domain
MLIKDIDPNLISEASVAADARDIAGNTALGTTGVQLGAQGLSKAGVSTAAKVASKAAKFVPFAGAAFNAADAASRYQQGDKIGAALSGAGVIPALSLPAMGIQAVRDKINTGSWLPDDAEIAAAYGTKVPAGGDPKVFTLQQQLIAKGAKNLDGTPLVPDGKMGKNTQAAMKQFGITAESLAENIELDRIKSLTSTLLKG